MAADGALLTIYGVPASQPCRTVMWLCAMHGIPYELEFVMPGSRKGTRSETYLALCPAGYVPAVKFADDGTVLWESNAILTYICERYRDRVPATMWPSGSSAADALRRAHIQKLLHWHHFGTRQVTLALFAPLARPDIKQTPAGLKMALKTATRAIALLEGALARHGGPFLLEGDAPTLADLCCFADVGQCQPSLVGLFDFGPYPHVTRWMANMERLPGFDEAHAGLRQLLPFLAKRKAKAAAAKL